MWIVRLALRRPISVAVMALPMLVLGTLSFFLMNIDIFPAINIPVVMVIWYYPGLSPIDVERRMVTLILHHPAHFGGGRGFLPKRCAGMMRMHVRAPTGTRIERSRTDRSGESKIRFVKIIPPDVNSQSISDNIGIPLYFDLGFLSRPTALASQDTDISIQLLSRIIIRLQSYQDQIRQMLAHDYPGVVGYFQAADIISQVLNFGLPAMIDVQISGDDLNSDYDYAAQLRNQTEIAYSWYQSTFAVAEPLDYPALKVNVDLTKALEVGVNRTTGRHRARSATLYRCQLRLNPTSSRPEERRAIMTS